MNLQQNLVNGTSALAREVIVIDPLMQSKSEHKLRVAAYARVSSDSTDQLNSFAAQVGHYTDLFGSNADWEMVDIYTDESITGTRADTRPDFQRMIQDCRKGKIDRILTKSISRFSRNTKDCLEILRELSALEITVFFEKENIDTAEIPSEFIITLFSSGAQEESYSISGNMRWSYQQRMKSGTFVASSTPYGYKLRDKKLSIVPEQAKIIRKIFADYLNGKGVQVIVNELNAECTPCKHNNATWSRTSVTYILRNERYIGDALFQKYFTTDTLPFVNMLNKGQKDRYYVSNTHNAIISREDFGKTQALLDYKYEKYANPTRYEYALKGSVRCENCHSFFRRKECRGNFYWCCHSHNIDRSKYSITQIPETKIFKAFTALYNKLKANCNKILLQMLEQLQALKASRNQNNIQVCEINKTIANFTEQNYVLSGLKVKGYIDSALYISQTNEINGKIAKLRADKNSLMASDDDDLMIIQTQNLIEILANTPAYLDNFEQSIFDAMVTKIVVISNDSVKFCLNNGLELTENVERTVRK